MKRVLAGFFAFVALSGGVEAATYRYDVTMARAHLSLDTLHGYGKGELDIEIPGLRCEVEPDFHYCEGEGDFTRNRFGIDVLNIYDSIISGTLIIDSDYNHYTGVGRRPVCSGSALLCRHTTGSSVFSVSASALGFSIFSGDGISYQNELSSNGLEYLDDGSYSFTLGNTSYSTAGWGAWAIYETTSLEIAPVPLPAGLMLLPSALILFGIRRRLTKKAV